MPYQPIHDYGIIGNMRTAALVSKGGSIDWYCTPRFDSPSVFAKILDDQKGGAFEITPADGEHTVKQLYWPETNILVTRFLSDAGIVEVIDFMPTSGPEELRHQMIRLVRCVRGSVKMRLSCTPAFDYARATHETTLTAQGAEFRGAGVRLALATKLALGRVENGVAAEFTLKEKDSATVTLRTLSGGDPVEPACTAEEGKRLFRESVEYWRGWISKCTYVGRWRESVHRSALLLKLLTYEPTGAIIASPTCSLPEKIGGERNWDYRYTWVRDAAFSMYALMRVGFHEEAGAFMKFLAARVKDQASDDGSGPLQIVYGIEGETDLSEQILGHLDGYRGSKPVRIGNGAHEQLQLDIYGELLDAVYLHSKHGTPLPYEGWKEIRALLDWLMKNWKRPDEGIWEVRSGKRQFTYSKLMCWVAFDRAIRLASKRSFPADLPAWLKTRDEIYEEIMAHGWNAELNAFTQAFDDDCLDASALIMPLTFFVSPGDPRLLSTIDAILKSPSEGGLSYDGLVYRYNDRQFRDGFEGGEGTFNLCTFWLIEALTRASASDHGKLELARTHFEKMLGNANHLGLYSEQTDLVGRALGNFPQAFTHLSLISAAFNLDRVLSGKSQGLSSPSSRA